jgi:hypothetical protein
MNLDLLITYVLAFLAGYFAGSWWTLNQVFIEAKRWRTFMSASGARVIEISLKEKK